MSSTLCSFTVASSGWSLFLLFAVLPVPILRSSSFSKCSRNVGVSLGLFDCTKGFDFNRIRFAGVHSPGFSGSSLEVSNCTVSLMSLATGLTVLSPIPVIGVVSRVRVVGWSWVFHSYCRFRRTTLCFLPPGLAHAAHPAVLPISSQKSPRIHVLVFQPIVSL